MFAAFLGAILIYGGAFAWYLLVHFDLVNLITDVNQDDSFYYHQIARHLSEGKFSTFDGGITRTNGYHPAWLLLITPFHLVLDAERALFAVKAFEIMLVAGGVALIVAAARLAHLPWILLLAVLPALYGRMNGVPVAFWGLEAAASIFWTGLLFLSLVLFGRNPGRWVWALSAVAFSLPWVRLEFAAISLAATAALCLFQWLNDRTVPLPWVKAHLGAWAGIFAYLLYNRLFFGAFVPVSGLVKTGVFSARIWEAEGGFDLSRNLAETFRLPAAESGIHLAAATVGVGVVTLLLAFRGWRRNLSAPEIRLPPFFMAGALALAAGHVARFLHSGFFLAPYQSTPVWYYVPAHLMGALLLPLVGFGIVSAVRLFTPLRVGSILASLIAIVGVVLLIARTDFRYPFSFVRDRSASPHPTTALSMYAGARIMDRLLPEGSIVGSWDAGILGYFSRYPVLNLDGVVNSHEYYRSLRRSGYTWANTPESGSGQSEFVRRHGISHFANHIGENSKPIAGDVLYDGEPLAKRFAIWTSEPPRAPFDVWERLEPHFDHRLEDIGIIRDGRLAHALVRKCATGDLLEWSWMGEESRTSHTGLLEEISGGVCIGAIVLPRGAIGPVRAETEALDDFLASLPRGGERVIESDFTVFLLDDRLAYLKQQPCAPADRDIRFFIHLVPVDASDLPAHRRRFGFEIRNFSMGAHNAVGNRCLAVRSLPDYPIAEIRTGQWSSDGWLWQASFRTDDAQGDRTPEP